ncbi:MAG: leucine-rich repeat domain-containing protein, partial [Muribaculaceae bacterium]|nr:leucine-rich repeat domain-containing protein [Muribaculaceae bacterium]
TSIMANVVITGDVYSKDLALALRQDFVARTVKKLDLSSANIIADVLTPTSDEDKIANYIPANLFYNTSGINPVKPIVEEIILPKTVVRIGDAAFQNCVNLKEIRLPESLVPEKIVVGTYASGSPKYGYAIGAGAFTGCTSLTTIFIPGDLATANGRQVVCHFNPINTVYGDQYGIQSSGLIAGADTDYSKITIVVPEQYLSVYNTAYNDLNYGNPWKYFKFNVVSQNPVYGVNFDASRVAAVDPDMDITKMAVFLGDNVALESIKAEGKLKLINPAVECLVFDNGKQIQPNADGTIDVEFFNPAKNAAAAGNHNIEVINTYDVNFNTTSSLFTIAEPEVSNEIAYKSGDFDRTVACILYPS